MSEVSAFAEIIFYAAFILDLLIMYFGFVLYKQIKGSTLAKVTLFASLSALIFGLHIPPLMPDVSA